MFCMLFSVFLYFLVFLWPGPGRGRGSQCTTTWVAVAINLGVAVIAWLLPERETGRPSADTPEGFEVALDGAPEATSVATARPGYSTGTRYDKPVVTAVLRYALIVDRGGGAAPEEVFAGDRLLQLLGASWIVLYGIAVYS